MFRSTFVDRRPSCRFWMAVSPFYSFVVPSFTGEAGPTLALPRWPFFLDHSFFFFFLCDNQQKA